VSKEKVNKKDKWGSIRYKQADNIYSAEIKNGIKGALRPSARMGPLSMHRSSSIFVLHWPHLSTGCYTAVARGSIAASPGNQQPDRPCYIQQDICHLVVSDLLPSVL